MRGEERWLPALGVAVATAVAVADLLLDARAAFVAPLVAGPLIAATRGGARATAAVLAYCLLVAIPLGWIAAVGGSAEHVSGVVTVAIGGALAVGIAHLRDERERGAASLEVQYGVARVLSEEHALESAAPRLLEAIGRPLGWDLAILWEAPGGGGLRRLEHWRAADGLAPPDGPVVAGAASEGGRPTWVDLGREGLERPPAGLGRPELRAGAAFPVRGPSGTGAVIELLGRRARRPEPGLIELMEALGAQIGDFLEGLAAEAAVRESEARKGAVLRSALDCVVTIDHEGTVLEFNEAGERMFGYSPEEAIGRELAELLVPPAMRQAHREGLRRCVETGEGRILGRRVELTGMRADGGELPVELAVNRVAGTSPPLFTATVRDITDRRHAEHERDELLRREREARRLATEARDQLDAILRGVADAVTAQAPDGTLLFVNDAAAETLGFASREELLGTPGSEILGRYEVLDEEGRPFPADELPGRRALRGEDAPAALVRFRVRATGEERWSVVKAVPIRGGDGAVTMAINVIEDITEHKRAELRQRFLAEGSRVLAASLDPDETLRRVATLAVPEIADWCAVDVREPGGSVERVALAHSDPALLESAKELQERYPPDPSARRGVSNVLRTGRSELHPEVPEGLLEEGAVDEEHLRLLRRFGLRSAMVVPMTARGRTIGALSFVSGRSGRRFDERDLELVEELGRRCGTAIDNARLFTDRAYIAKTLQDSLLPAELPAIPGVEAAARFRPAGEGNEVGGDFYDVFETGGSGFTVVMGDVCGKGPDAAAVTALARYTLRAAAMRERVPSRSLRILNEALLRQRDDLRFCTVAYAYLEAADGRARVSIASGGHPLPLVVRHGGRVEALGSHGTLLGVVPDPRLEDRSTRLEPGDALVLYTDGVTDARGGGLREERLLALLGGCTGRAAGEIADAVERAALDAQLGQPDDDIAVLVLRVAGTTIREDGGGPDVELAEARGR